MKRTSILSLLVFSFLLIAPAIFAQIEHLEPPFWWAGMKNPNLQLMVHGKDISKHTVELSYDGVTIQSVSSVKNPNFLFIDLKLDPEVLPGKFDIHFLTDGKIVFSYSYELKHREPGSAEREGFNNSDVMYLIMPDRFANGNPSNDAISEMKEKPDRNEMLGRHGGDIKGIADHLDYIASLGFTAIWLNPVLENNQERSSYHGYSTTDFYRVDPRFGTNKEYRDLCHLAKEKGLKMVMDMIFNHCGSEHWWMKDMPATDWINYYPEYVSTNHRRTVNQDPYASNADYILMRDGWFVRSMPDMNVRNPFFATYLIQNSIWWIEYAGLAGIRMDTYPYPDKFMMAEWNRRVLKEYPHFNIVGEEWSENQATVSYWQKGQANRDGYDGNLPSLMDFPLQSALRKSLTEKEEWGQGLIRLYEALAYDFLYPDPNNLVIFPDNHDMSRFYMQVGMNDALYKLGITYILTTRGIPQIFYGSEILMTHTESNHHGHIRKDFPGGWAGDRKNGFTGEGLAENELEMQQFFKKLLIWRQANPVVHTGKFIHFAPEDGTYVYFRYNDKDKIMVILNKNSNQKELKLDRFAEMLHGITQGSDIISGKTFELSKTMILPAMAPLVLELK